MFEKITHFNKKSGPIGGREDLKKDEVLIEDAILHFAA